MKDQSRRGFRTRLWQSLNTTALVLSILASSVAILAYLEARGARKDLKALIEEGKKWEVSLRLLEPADRAEVFGYVTRIAGSIEFRTTAVEVQSPSKVNLALEEKNVELVPVVRPLSEAKWWWVQASPLVRQDGTFEGSVFIGEKTGIGIGVEFQLAVLAVPKGSMSEGARLVNLPFSYVASNTVTVRRAK